MKPLCGWRMPEEDVRAMLALLEGEIAGAAGQPQRRAALERFRGVLEEDLRAMREERQSSAA